MLPDSLVRYRRPLILIAHAVLVVAAYAAAFALRYEGAFPSGTIGVFLRTVGVLVVVRLVVFTALGLHRGFWKHFGLHDLTVLAKAAAAGSVVFALLLWAFGWLGPVPRAVIVIEGMVTFLASGGLRMVMRAVLEGRWSRRPAPAKRVVVVGAGEAGERLLRQLEHDSQGRLRVIALLDDDPGKRGRTLHGVRVAGSVDRLAEIVAREQIDMVVIAISRATPEQFRRIVNECLRVKVEFKRLPSMREMLEGAAKPGVLADVELEHLLVREPVRFDEERVSGDVGGQVVLITGGAGSVGSELARQIARAHPAKLVLVERAESALYYVHLELQRAFPSLDIVPAIADVTDRAAMDSVFAQHRPNHVFHAAAYKHVPLMEGNVREAVRNNVMGTLIVAERAARFGTKKFVLISTDKAVRPSSVMGATKRVAERIVLGWPELRAASTEFRAVRFGNVLGSDGSVVPLFRRQLAAGGPLTVTHPEVERYFMTITEAAQLVLHAATIPHADRRITMLDMGEPIRILDLAEHLVRLSGMEPYRDVQIVFTGLRPGEKLQEELMSAVEVTVPSGLEKVSIVQTDEVDGAAVQHSVERLVTAAERGDQTMLLGILRELVPECVPPLRGTAVAPVAGAAPHRERATRSVHRSGTPA